MEFSRCGLFDGRIREFGAVRRSIKGRVADGGEEIGGMKREVVLKAGLSGLVDYAAQHFLYFLPLPHGHGSFLPTVFLANTG
jgi:hypothetical protein